MSELIIPASGRLCQYVDDQGGSIKECLPYILRDLTSLGGNPDVVVELVKWNIAISQDFHIIDLGCGKGATIAAMAKRLSGNYTGVDVMPEFIAEGTETIKNQNFFSSVSLVLEDLRATINKAFQYDIVIYSYDFDLLGSVSESIEVINRIKKKNGYIVFSAAFKNKNCSSEDYLSKIELYDEINKSGLEVVDFEIWDRKRESANRKINNHLIKERLEQLKTRRPKLKELLDEYYFNLLNETKTLNTYVDSVTFLLK